MLRKLILALIIGIYSCICGTVVNVMHWGGENEYEIGAISVLIALYILNGVFTNHKRLEV